MLTRTARLLAFLSLDGASGKRLKLYWPARLRVHNYNIRLPVASQLRSLHPTPDFSSKLSDGHDYHSVVLISTARIP